MDLAELNLNEPYRTWHALGLRHVLHRPDGGPSLSASSREPYRTEPDFSQILGRLRSRLRPPHQMVWTYWELPVDLGSAPSPERRILWQKMISGLQLPQGAVFFWPMSEETPEGIKPRPDLFWPILEESGAGILVCFGQKAFSCLFPDHPFIPEPFMHQQCTVLALPGPEEMLPDNRSAKGIVYDALLALPLRKNK